MGDFDVFDEWGSFVGTFTPAGGGFGCLFGIAILILLAAGFVVYMLIKMVVMGFVALSKGKWGEAVMYWLVPGLLALVFTLQIIGSVAITVAQQRRAEESDRAYETEYRWALDHPSMILSFTRVKDGPSCNELGCRQTEGEYRVTNNLSLIGLELSSDQCSPGGMYGLGTLKPKETQVVYCVEWRYGDNVVPCIEAREAGYLSHSDNDYLLVGVEKCSSR
ncbi:MAG TPA: hypothetical protein VI791_02305 [Patescibacteria group bacterium]|nr:hypothetical protein [Patescibacteria group bacterium]